MFFLHVTGKNIWWEVQKNEYGFHSYQKEISNYFSKDKGNVLYPL